jgi:transcriptional regulator of acetoin/glycerol metabolism
MFLDEVGEIPLELQPKLLRVLQEREFERLGSSRTLRTDARVIAATNRDLSTMVDVHGFRSDLYYRLNVFPIYVPPLRERTEDIPFLVRHFAQHFARLMKKQIDTISSDTMNALTRYPWPGNIRELQNVIERAVILSPGKELKVPSADLKPRLAENGSANGILTLARQPGWESSAPHCNSACVSWEFHGRAALRTSASSGRPARIGLRVTPNGGCSVALKLLMYGDVQREGLFERSRSWRYQFGEVGRIGQRRAVLADASCSESPSSRTRKARNGSFKVS